jgi:hypothetical protein
MVEIYLKKITYYKNSIVSFFKLKDIEFFGLDSSN